MSRALSRREPGGSRGPCLALCSVSSQANLLPRRSQKNQFRFHGPPWAWAGPAGERVGSLGGGVGGLHEAGAPLRVMAWQRGPKRWPETKPLKEEAQCSGVLTPPGPSASVSLPA